MHATVRIILFGVIIMVLAAGAWLIFQPDDKARSADQELSTDTNEPEVDTDEFFWGTEGQGVVEGSATKEKETDIINAVLGTRYVKIRLTQPVDARGNTIGSGFGPEITSLPVAGSKVVNYDEVAAYFEKNGWSMVPMISPRMGPGPVKGSLDGGSPLREGKDITEEDMDNYAAFVEWFVGRYKDKADIRFVELANAPSFSWPGTSEQLLMLNNKAYEKVKSAHPEIMMGTPGFEYFNDVVHGSFSDQIAREIANIEYFLDKKNNAKFDFWAFHGYAARSSLEYIYPPTKTAEHYTYIGIPGILEIRKRLDANGWQDREIIDTEHIGIMSTDTKITAEADKLNAAYLGQSLLLKRTVGVGDGPAMAGTISLKVLPKGSGHKGGDSGDSLYGCLNSDGTATEAVRSVGLLWSMLDGYDYAGHVSGEFDSEDQVWIEKFTSRDNKELYIFFKPFEHTKGQKLALDGRTAQHELTLSQVPSTVLLTTLGGEEKILEPARTIKIHAENALQFLEITIEQ